MNLFDYLETKQALERDLQMLRLDFYFGSFDEMKENIKRQNEKLSKLIKLETEYLKSITVTL